MSTRAIESVLRWAKDEHADVERAADDALSELAAIRKAAKVLNALTGIYAFHDVAETRDDIRAAKALLAAIAKEAP